MIDDAARHALADLLCLPYGGLLANISGDHLVVRKTVMNAHPLSADPAYYAALQQAPGPRVPAQPSVLFRNPSAFSARRF